MGFFDRFLDFFGIKRRERVQTIAALPSVLQVQEPQEVSDQRRLPGVSKIPSIERKVRARGLSYFVPTGQRREWVYPQYDHYEVEVIFDIESYFARATRAKLNLFLREGFEFVGSNDERVEYVRARIRQIERVSGLPFESLLYQTCRDLLVHSNAYWVKVRKPEASGGRTRTVGQKMVKPVAGYFSLPPETMVPQVDSKGNVVRWKQEIDGEERIFALNDIAHFCTNKKSGYPLGIPSIIPVKDDIRALRSIEANIDVLIHKHLFPIILWKVGTTGVDGIPAQTFANGDTEIDIVKEEIANMPTEGSLVVSERYNVEAIGAENKALRVEAYLTHFRERLLAGLDVSSVDVGIGNTSSRSTAQTLSRNLIDTVKLQQTVIENLAVRVIEELLLESTFAPDSILEPDNLVFLRFHEIDKEAKQAEANHLTDLFLKNVITHPELRMGIGREPLTPEEESELHWEKFAKKELLINSVDEDSGLGVGTATKILSGGSSTSGGSSGSVQNKNKPKNQHGERKSTKLKKDNFRDSFRDAFAASNTLENPILRWHLAIRDELQARWAIGDLDFDLAEADIRTTYDIAYRDFIPILREIVRENYPDPERIHSLYASTERRARKYIDRLMKDVVRQLKVGKNSPNVIFDSVRYRTVLIHDTEQAWAENLARFRWFKRYRQDMQIAKVRDACEICTNQLTVIKWDDRLGEAKIPPYHPLCQCGLEAARKAGQ